MRLFRPLELAIKEIPWIASQPLARVRNPAAFQFHSTLTANGYRPDVLLNVMPRHNLIYIAVPKAGSTRIRKTLARIDGRHSRTLQPARRLRFRGPYGPRNITIDALFRIASNPDTLRFSFVRNPYARAVSCWADKFADKPLVPGDDFIDSYLAMRQEIDAGLPAGPERTLSFPEFTIFAAATAKSCHDIHLQAQDDIISMPGIELNLIGKLENFNADFAGVLDFLNAADDIRREAAVAINKSHHHDWPLYYTLELADRIYRTYERDFDRFGYTRAIP